MGGAGGISEGFVVSIRRKLAGNLCPRLIATSGFRSVRTPNGWLGGGWWCRVGVVVVRERGKRDVDPARETLLASCCFRSGDQRELFGPAQLLDRRLPFQSARLRSSWLCVCQRHGKSAAGVSRRLASSVGLQSLREVVRDARVERPVRAPKDVDEPGHGVVDELGHHQAAGCSAACKFDRITMQKLHEYGQRCVCLQVPRKCDMVRELSDFRLFNRVGRIGFGTRRS